MNHKVRNVQELYVSAEQLYKQGVIIMLSKGGAIDE